MAPLPALVLTAGLGTRLRPLSSVRAKAAMPVAGEPLVRRILGWLAGQGIARAVLNLHHKPETICAVVGDGSDLGLEVRYSWEDPVLGSAGGPRRALPLLEDERFLLVNGDTLTDLHLGALARAHAESGALVTLAVVPNRQPWHYGGVLVGEDGRVTGFVGRGSASPSWHFIGVQVAEARAFAALSPDEPAESIGGLYPELIRRDAGSVRAFRCDASFADVGTPDDYLETCFTLAGPGASGRPQVGERCLVAASARLERSILWDDVQVGDGTSLTECVVGDAVVIPAGARWARRAIVRAADGEAGPGDAIVDDLLVAPIDRDGRAPRDGGPQPS